MMRSEIGYCVWQLFFRRWEWTFEGRSRYLWEKHHAAHVEAYWRERLRLALE